MRFVTALILAGASLLLAEGPDYTSDGKLVRPANYREWIFLSSGLGMNYGAETKGDPLFTNVFVPPASYRAFNESGHWPEKTMFVLEIRQPSSHGSINKSGSYQSDLIGVEIEVKDSSRFPEKWAYFDFIVSPGKLRDAAAPIAHGSVCHTCHSTNGAVENTFVQFYPTLIEVAQHFGTMKSGH